MRFKWIHFFVLFPLVQPNLSFGHQQAVGKFSRSLISGQESKQSTGEQPIRFNKRRSPANYDPSNQCPLANLAQHQRSHKASSLNERIYVNESTGLRTFNARVVGIFSCSDADSASNDLTLDFRLAKPVIDYAIGEARRKYAENIHFNVTYRTAGDVCRHQQAAGHAADEYYVNGANYFVGPGCSESLASVGQLASYWDVPMCSTGYLPEVITARFSPLTLMQLSLSVQSVGEMLLELFKMYKWRHLVIVTEDSHPLHSAIRDGLLEFFHTMYVLTSSPSSGSAGSQPQPQYESKQKNFYTQQQQQYRSQLPVQEQKPLYYINITSRNFAYSRAKDLDYEEVMLDAASYSRIMLLLARSKTIDKLLEAAHKQGMSKGQFVFIAHELFETRMFDQGQQQSKSATNFSLTGENVDLINSKLSKDLQSIKEKYALDDKIEIRSRVNNLNGSGEDLRDRETLKEIFQPLMTISLRIPTSPQLDIFRLKVASLSEKEFNYRMQSLKSIYSLGLAALIYDCIMLYADKVNYILRETQFDKIDGRTIFDLTAGKTFHGALTGDLTINRAGQRVIDFTLNDFSPKSLTLEPIAHFMAEQGKLNFLPGKKPHWATKNHSIPRSDPRCRLNDLFCRFNEEEANDLIMSGNYIGSDRFVLGVWLLIIIIFSVALTSSIIGWIVYRRFRIESELLNLWWSIKYEDIIFEDEADVMCDGKRSMSSLAISNESFNDTQLRAGAGAASGAPSAAGAAPPPSAGSGRASPQLQPTCGGQQRQLACDQAASAPQTATNLQLSVSHQDGPFLSQAQSTSTLSVTAPSLAGSVSGLNFTIGQQQEAQNSSGPPMQATQGHQAHLQQPGNPSGASKLLPLISKQQNFKNNLKPSSAGNASGKLNQIGGSQTVKNNPSISSQNKNIKLKLGTILNGRGAASGSDSSGMNHTTKVGLYKASRVAVKHLNVKNLNINRQLLIELRQVRDLTHENLIKFIGLCPEEPNVAIVSELCTRGNLQDLLQNESIRLDWSFRYSIINDIVDGLIHLHSSPIQYHGRLKSSNCVIDNRFVVKLTDFGLPTLLAAVDFEEEVINPRMLLWTAPEHLRTKHPLLSGSQKGDIYSLAIIFQEIITRCGPFECEPILCGPSQAGGEWFSNQPQQAAPLIRTTDAGGHSSARQAHRPPRAQQQQQQQRQPMFLQPIVVQHKQRLEPEEIVNLVRMGLSPPFRPYFRPDVMSAEQQAGGAGGQPTVASATGDFNVADLIAVVQSCWQEAPTVRPSVASVKQQIKKMRRGCHLDGANLMDNLLQRMERYTDNLESLVEQKTAELMEEKKRSEELLYEMLPRFVVDQLKYGHSVTPEAYEAVTISFSDIKDFTSIAAQSSPIEVVNLLNQLYTEFDDCIDQYDVYKVETIGDAYMVVSGLPVRNGDQHAREIAEMSLALLELIRNFDVVHLPHVNLQLRIGIHSGPCASGVVGTRMFRYCLFGDTVNTASRMESHGEPMKIHTSEDSANILSKFGNFLLEPRGEIEIKGKGLMNTFWLVGKT